MQCLFRWQLRPTHADGKACGHVCLSVCVSVLFVLLTFKSPDLEMSLLVRRYALKTVIFIYQGHPVDIKVTEAIFSDWPSVRPSGMRPESL